MEKDSGSHRMFELEIFVLEFLPVNGLSSCPVAGCEIAALDHEILWGLMRGKRAGWKYGGENEGVGFHDMACSRSSRTTTGQQLPRGTRQGAKAGKRRKVEVKVRRGDAP